MEKVNKIFAQACEELGISNELPVINNQFGSYIIATYKLKVIMEWINGGWVPDFTDWGQEKFYPLLAGGAAYSGASAGMRFVIIGNGPSSATANIGFRLACFKSRELCETWAPQLVPLYRESSEA